MSDIIKYYKALEFLYHKHGMTLAKILASGSNGIVFKLWDLRRQRLLAVKATKTYKINCAENNIWPSFLHPNIIPILCIERTENINLYIMALKEETLEKIIGCPRFKFKPNSYLLSKKWIYQILCGLNYIHVQNYCHLNLKIGNVLLSKQSNAILFNFSFLHSKKTILKYDHIGLPLHYQPPEIWHPEIALKLDGRKIDLWSFGILIIELLLGEPFLKAKQREKCKSDWKNVVPSILEKIFDTNYFEGCLRRNFLQSSIMDKEARNLNDLLSWLLNYDPNKRRSTLDCLSHPYFNEMKTNWITFHHSKHKACKENISVRQYGTPSLPCKLRKNNRTPFTPKKTMSCFSAIQTRFKMVETKQNDENDFHDTSQYIEIFSSTNENKPSSETSSRIKSEESSNRQQSNSTWNNSNESYVTENIEINSSYVFDSSISLECMASDTLVRSSERYDSPYEITCDSRDLKIPTISDKKGIKIKIKNIWKRMCKSIKFLCYSSATE